MFKAKRWKRLTDRRRFLSLAGAGGTGLVLGGCAERAPEPITEKGWKRPVILLRSGWQTVNIGDIAHTPGVLRLLEQHLPEALIVLWSNAVDRGVEAMLRWHFPRVKLVQGDTDEEGKPDSPPLQHAFDTCDFLLHGSGPSVVGRRHLEAWRKQTGKPYGIFGVTITMGDEAGIQAIDPGLRELLEGAKFVFTRETTSLKNLSKAMITGTQTAFAPDGTFSLNILNDEAAKMYMTKNELDTKKYICVVPRLRYTPYHKFRPVSWTKEEIERRTKINKQHAEEDHAKLRVAIVRWVRETGNKVLLCPEMTYQLDIIDPLLYNPLPADVKRKVVRRRKFWLPDEAASIYRRAVAVLSFECHSPIIAAANDTPCMYIHQPEDGIKGQMWKDVGLNRWYMEVQRASGERIADELMDIHTHYANAQVDVHEAVIYARKLQADGMTVLRKLVMR